MKFKDFDVQMRKYEESKSVSNLLPDVYVVARLDGKGFTKWTAGQEFEKPFDIRFQRMMENTLEFLMGCLDIKIAYGYTQSDEISLLLDSNNIPFNAKERKLNSILPSVASAYFSKLSECICLFDCRIIVLPNKEKVVDYFQWRQEDATRNALNGYSYWTLRKTGLNGTQASKLLINQTVSFKNELLFQNGINFNEVPTWQRRGVGSYWQTYQKEGYNPIKKEPVITERKTLITEKELPYREIYTEFLYKKVLK